MSLCHIEMFEVMEVSVFLLYIGREEVKLCPRGHIFLNLSVTIHPSYLHLSNFPPTSQSYLSFADIASMEDIFWPYEKIIKMLSLD